MRLADSRYLPPADYCKSKSYHSDLAQASIPYQLASFLKMRPGALPGPGLHDPAIFASRCDHGLPFADDDADRFFHVDILARLASLYGHVRMPMVRRGDAHGVDRWIGEHLAEIGGLLRLVARPASHRRSAFEVRLIHIAKRCDSHAGLRHRGSHVLGTHHADTDEPDCNAIIGTTDTRAERGIQRGHAGSAQEITAV